MRTKQVLKRKEQLDEKDIEQKIRSAKQTNDYVQIVFNQDKFIKISFEKDQTYTLGYNIYDMTFTYKVCILCKQYSIANVQVLTKFLVQWVNKFNT